MGEDNQTINNPSILSINFENLLLKSLKPLVLLAYSFPHLPSKSSRWWGCVSFTCQFCRLKHKFSLGTAGKIHRFVGTLRVFVEGVGRFGGLGADPYLSINGDVYPSRMACLLVIALVWRYYVCDCTFPFARWLYPQRSWHELPMLVHSILKCVLIRLVHPMLVILQYQFVETWGWIWMDLLLVYSVWFSQSSYVQHPVFDN